MLNRLEHIAVAVESIEAAREKFDRLFGEPSGTEEVEAQKVRVCFYELGNVRIELVQPTSEESAVAKFLSKRGEGIHHIAFAVKGIKDVLKRLAEAGFRLIDEVPRRGAGGKMVAFLHPASTGRVLMELCEGGE